MIQTPILLVAFNRPNTTKQVFEHIRIAKPIKLYIALDSPRRNKEGEENLCQEVKIIVENVNWPCEVFYKVNDENKGAEVTVSSAISWVLESEEYLIILEDDIVAPISFFLFAQEMLERYIDEPQIATITGSNVTPIDIPENTDYFFAKYGHSHGWATWKRAWQKFDLNIKIPNGHLKTDFLKKICNSKAEVNYYRKIFKNIKKKGAGNSTWDVVGLYIFRVSNSLSVIPRVNLTSNIGTYGLHAHGLTEYHFLPFDENFRVEKHPNKIECFVEYDKHHFKKYINKKKPFIKRVLRKLKKIIHGKK
jgi:hypothetical protein